MNEDRFEPLIAAVLMGCGEERYGGRTLCEFDGEIVWEHECPNGAIEVTFVANSDHGESFVNCWHKEFGKWKLIRRIEL